MISCVCEIKLVFLLLICLVSILLFVQPQELEKGRGGNFALPNKELPGCYPKQMHHFIFSTATCQSSNLSTSSPHLLSVFLIMAIHHRKHEVVSHYGFDLHSLDG